MQLKDFQAKGEFRWKLQKEQISHANTDVEIIGSRKILENALLDSSLEQVINVACLPTIVSSSLAMPDIHYGYGFCIGGVAAFPADSGIVLPGGVGYDINCGVRLISTNLNVSEIQPFLKDIGFAILNGIPTGIGEKSRHQFTKKQFMDVLAKGAAEIVSGFNGHKEDLQRVESNGTLPFSDMEAISQKALERGKNQLGTLGSGNHFIELQVVDEIYDEAAAQAFNIKIGEVTIMIHTGSRGFGHQVASDYIELLRKKKPADISVPDPQLIYTEIDSKLGKHYLQAINAASNFAWANRHLIMLDLIDILSNEFLSQKKDLKFRLVYDQAHNIAKFETHSIQGKNQLLLVHRKGATRAFPPHHPDVPALYAAIGQPVLIPGSMGTASYVLKGTAEAMNLTLGSSAHGAGRQLSRHQAIKFAKNQNVRQCLEDKNIWVFTFSNRGLMEEIPEAYKDIDDVINATDQCNISKKVARMKPLVVIKG